MTDAALEHSWKRISAELRGAVTDVTWHLWLEPLRPREMVGDAVVVEAPDRVRSWVSDRFGRLLQSCAAAVLGPDVRVELVAPGTSSPARSPGATRPVNGPSGPIGRTDDFHPRFTFDQFVIGDANRMAHAAALAVAELPGLAYNPLFICGAPGLGKTHLLHSIANYVREYGGGATVRYTTIESFTNHFLGALHAKSVDAFKDEYRRADVLLVDDVQFLQSKAKTEEEFFHTFNAVMEAGAQLVLTSDRPPADLVGLEDRLRERFAAGLVTDVVAPDRSMRMAILRKRVAQDGIEAVDPEALALIADRVDQNIRTLEGALIRVVAFASLTHKPVTAELAAEVLAGLYPDLRMRRDAPSLQEIQEATCRELGVTLEELRGPGRSARAAFARQVAMYLSRELTSETLPAIGRAFGRNHTTVMHACKRTAQRIAEDASAFETVHRVTESLR